MKLDLSEIISKLSKRSQSERYAIYVASFVIITVLYYFMFFAPTVEKISSMEVQVKESEGKLRDATDQVSSLEQLQAEIKELEELLKESMEQLPKGDEIADLLKQISDYGRSSGLEIRKFERKQENLNSAYEMVAEVPIELSVQGSFHRVAMFFDQISQMSRIVHVKNINISLIDSEKGQEAIGLEVEGDIIAFRLLTEAERKEKEAMNKKRRKRKR